MKKILSSIILITILFQGANRTGLLGYLYEQRHEIAFALHLTEERVITECKSDYFLIKNLTILSADDQKKLPVSFSSSLEINLFAPTESFKLLAPGLTATRRIFAACVQTDYRAALPAIFHPPGN